MLRTSLLLLALVSTSFAAGVNVLTHHNDNLRTGANLHETALTPANVNSGQFGKLFEQTVDGYVYAQPLYVSGLVVNGAAHNVVFVATEHDSVYAFDADNNAAPLWQHSFIDPNNGITSVPNADVNTNDIIPEIGITGTPVIDPVSSTLYFVVKTKENGVWFQRLHALDLATGQEKPGSPATIAATVLGQGDNNNGVIIFNALTQNQRSALLLLNGVVYITWASHGDNTPAHGWVMGYDARTLAQLSLYNTTPDGTLGGIWMSGCGPAADAQGNIYFSTGNGSFDTDPATGHHVGNDFGDTLLKISTKNRSLALLDFFTPANQQYLDDNDLDFGAGGVMLLPDQPGSHPHLAIATGKFDITYVINRDQLGGYSPGNPPDDGAYESLPSAIVGSFGDPAYFNGRIYYHGSGYGGADILKAFAIQKGLVNPSPVSSGADFSGFPGSTPSISASGTANGIVWEIQRSNPAKLYASRADDVSQLLYTSDDADNSRDQPAGNGVKFSVPTIANGKVYVGTDSTLAVYGLLNDSTLLTVNISGSGAITSGFSPTSNRQTNTTLSITATPSPGFVFDCWTDADGDVLSRSPKYTFVMRKNLILNARFLPNPFPDFTGNYSALIQGNSPTILATGLINLSIGKNGMFTASIRFAGHTINLRGAFNAEGGFTTILNPHSLHSTLISLTLDGSGGLTGTISNDFAGGDITGGILVTSASPISANLVGKYTLLFPVAADPTAPQGIGYGSATLDKFGHLRLAGILGDGTAFTESSTVTQNQDWPLFTPMYAGKGLLTGILSFINNNNASNLQGQLYWFKPRPGSPPLSVVTDAIGSLYQPVNPILPLTSGTGAVTLQLSTPISQAVTSGTGLTLSIPDPLSLTFNPLTGIFTGAFTSGTAKGKYGGAIFQDQNFGQGTYILSGSTGAVNLQ